MPDLIADDFLKKYKPDKQINTDEFLAGYEGKKFDLSPAWETLRNIGKLYPTLETMAHIGSMTYGLPASGYAGLATLAATRDLSKAAEAVEKTSEALIYQPQTKAGQQLTGTSFYPFEKLHEIGAAAGGKVAEKGYPKLGALTQTAIEASPVLIHPLARKAKGYRAGLKPKLPPEPPGTIETEYLSKKFGERFQAKPTPKLRPSDRISAAARERQAAIEKIYPSKLKPKSGQKLLPPGQGFVMYDRPNLDLIQRHGEKLADFRKQEKIAEQTKADTAKFDEKITFDEKGGIKLYSGLPLDVATKFYTEKIGSPIWDKAIMQGVPKLLEKVPGGKAINRALLYDYRGSLPDTAKYIRSMEDMKKFQAIGREYAIDLGSRLQKMPEDAQLRMGQFIRGEIDNLVNPAEMKHALEAQVAMLDLGRQAVDVGLLSENTFFKNAGRYMPRLYTSKEYQGLLTKYGMKKPNRLDLSRFKRRKDIPKEIREEMGEILTPGYPIAKGIVQLTHDIEMQKFFKGVADDPKWAWISTRAKGKPIPEGFKQLPGSDKLGPLNKAYVHPEIYADLNEAIQIMSQPEKVWRKALGAWKFGKVILSPKTHSRNLMSNSVLAHLGGMPMYEQPFYLTKAAKEMRGKGDLWKAAKDEGLFSTTWTAGELKSLFNQIEGDIGGIKAQSIPEKFGRVGEVWAKSKEFANKAAKIYNAEEEWFKLAKFIHNIDRKKMNPKAAAADAEKWLFNYSKLTKFQEKYRSKPYGAPFATFTFKALPRIAEAGIKHPHRFILPASIMYMMQKSAMMMIGDTEKEFKAKKELLPEWMQKEGFAKVIDSLGLPNFARFPFVDDYGREHWLNLTYILPWGDIGESGSFMGLPGALMPFSQPFVKEPISQIFNYDPFWGEKIVKEKDVAGLSPAKKRLKAAKLRATHALRTLAPTPFIDIHKGIQAYKVKPDYRGRIKSPGTVAADVFGGIKLYPVDYNEQLYRKLRHIDPGLTRKIETEIKTLQMKRYALKKRNKDVSFYDKQIKEKLDQLKGLVNEASKIGKTGKVIIKK